MAGSNSTYGKDRVDNRSRRRFVAAAVYTTPVILTLKAEPAFASYGSNVSPGGGPPGPFTTPQPNGVAKGWVGRLITPGGPQRP